MASELLQPSGRKSPLGSHGSGRPDYSGPKRLKLDQTRFWTYAGKIKIQARIPFESFIAGGGLSAEVICQRRLGQLVGTSPNLEINTCTVRPCLLVNKYHHIV
ncbi:hypothetical protein ACJJTC_014726 [Scirpophaga incertulas]